MKNKEKQIDRGIRLRTQRSKKILGTLTGEETFYAKNIDKEMSYSKNSKGRNILLRNCDEDQRRKLWFIEAHQVEVVLFKKL